MTDPPPSVPAHLAMNAARKIAAFKAVSWLLVEAAGRLIGCLEPRALAGCGDETVSTRMTELRHFVSPTTSVARAHDLLVRHRLDWLPVAAGMFLVGTVSREALEKANAGPWNQPAAFEQGAVYRR